MPIDPDVQPLLDQLQTQIDALRNTDAQHAQHFDTTGAHISALHSADKALERQLTALAERVAVLEQGTPPPPPPTPVGGTWFGYTFSGLGTVLDQQPGIVRDFTGGGSIEASKIARTLSKGIPLWYSWKPDITGTAWRSGVENALRSTVQPDSPPLFICVWHEPEGSGDAGGGTPAAKSQRWRDAHSFLHEVALKLRGEGRPVFVAPIICDWTFWWTSKGSPQQHWYPKSWQDYDLMGFDVYPQGQMANGQGRIARLTTLGPNQPAPYDHDIRTDTFDAVRLCAGWAKECGKPWGSGETGLIDGSVSGADVQYPYSRVQRATRFREIADDITVSLPAEGLPAPTLWAWYLDGGCSLFNNGGSTDTASVQVWNATIATNPPIAQLKEAV